MIREEVLKYFKGDELATNVFLNKYSLNNNETPDELYRRLAKEFAKIEYNYSKDWKIEDWNKLSDYGKVRFGRGVTWKAYENKFYDLFKNFSYIVPGGSVMGGLGNGKPVSMSNCFVIKSPEDSVESIINTAKDAAQIYKRRGGVGLDISNLRPNGSNVNNAAQTTSGVSSWMELYSKVTEIIGQSGRRGALMISIDINHPDSPDFIRIKQNLSKVTGANVSVKLNDAFMKAVENDEDYLLTFPCDSKLSIDNVEGYKQYNVLYNSPYDTTIFKRVKAKELWNEIIHCAWNTGEPGILNWKRTLDYDPTSVYPELKAISTNPCQPSWATVLTPKGIKQFKDINIGDIIWSKEGWTEVISKQNSGVKDVYEYRTAGGSFYGTENHKVISNGKKIEAKDAESIDIINGTIEPDIVMKSNFNNAIIDGLVLGDGLVHEASNNLIYLCIGENDSDYFNSEIQLYIGEHRPGIKPYAYEVKTAIQSYELPLTYQRRIPERYFYADNWTVRKFLKGLFSANGSVVGNKVTFKTSSSILKDEVQILLSSVGIRSYYTTNKPKDAEFSNGIYNCKESYDINITTDRGIFYDNIGFLQQYKMLKLKDTLNNIRESTKTHDIISTNFISCEEVFNITVNNSSHTYWTGGVNVSNCGELPLGAYDSCRLICTNLYSLVNNPFTNLANIDYDLAYNIFYDCQVLADNLVDLELEAVDRILTKIQPDYIYSFKREDNEWVSKQSDEFKLWWNIRETGAKGRRTGTGITAYADMLAAAGLEYGSVETTEKLFYIKLQAELDASIDMAILRGSFPLWNLDREFSDDNNSGNDWYEFIALNYSAQYKRMCKYGRRNAGISTIKGVVAYYSNIVMKIG